MPYATLKSYQDKFEIKKHDYIVEGSFGELFYLCPDVFNEKIENGIPIEKNDNELAVEYRNQLTKIYDAVGPLLDDGFIKDYWLVITPSICDSSLVKFERPQKNNNFIVTKFNIEEIDLVEKLIIPSGVAGGSLQISENKRKRKATNSTLDVYVAVQMNAEHPNFVDWKNFGINSQEYFNAIFNLSLFIGHDTCQYFDSPLRTFMAYGSRMKFDNEELRFVEQYFDKSCKKTDGWHLGDGYVRGIMRNLDKKNIQKYIAIVDLFDSTGSDFSNYGLSLEELINHHKNFSENPWINIEYKE